MSFLVSFLSKFIGIVQLTEDLLTNKELKLHFVIDWFDCKHNPAIESQLSNDFEKLVNNKELSDFVFIVDNKEFYAHKNILSIRSNVFKTMFANHMIESQTNRCVTNDMESDVFEELLTFIYTGKSAKINSMCYKLLAAAEKY